MLQLFQESISLVNLPYTVLLGLVVFYWAMYLIGAVGSDALESLGLDFDADADLDVDVDADAQVGVHGQGGFLSSFLHFFYVGEVPVIVIFSILILSMWFVSVVVNHYLNNTSVAIAMLLALPILLVGLIATKSIVMPLAPWLKEVLDQSSDKVQIVGKTCLVTSMEATPKYGQAELQTEGAPILLNVKTREGVTMKKGAEAVVYDYDKADDTYLIAVLDINTTPDSEKEQ